MMDHPPRPGARGPIAPAALLVGLLPALLAIAAAAGPPPDKASPALTAADRVRLAEAFRCAEMLGSKVWDWSRAPFAILLVGKDHEYLLRHERPSGDFTSLGDDPLLKTSVWARPRKHSPDLLATFPAIDATPTIVIGQAESTAARTSTFWLVTLLHEHFHQWQYSQPGYYAEAEALGLTGGDTTGMWMLDYPFPYSEPQVTAAFEGLATSLSAALLARGQPEFPARLSAWMERKEAFRQTLRPNDYKYFAFQSWQEGIASYTEYQVARWAAAEYDPTDRYKQLPDYTPFGAAADAILQRIQQTLAAPNLAGEERTAFYAAGAAEGLLLDAAREGWRDSYMRQRFSLDGHIRESPRP